MWTYPEIKLRVSIDRPVLNWWNKLKKGQDSSVKKEIKKEVKDEPNIDEDDDDVDGVPMDDEDKVAEKAKFRHPAIPGGLLEPEQRNTGIGQIFSSS